MKILDLLNRGSAGRALQRFILTVVLVAACGIALSGAVATVTHPGSTSAHNTPYNCGHNTVLSSDGLYAAVYVGGVGQSVGTHQHKYQHQRYDYYNGWTYLHDQWQSCGWSSVH